MNVELPVHSVMNVIGHEPACKFIVELYLPGLGMRLCILLMYVLCMNGCVDGVVAIKLIPL